MSNKPMTRVPNAVDRKLLREALKLPDKIDPTVEGTYPNVMLCSRWRKGWLGIFTVIVKKSATDRVKKTSKHRVFVLCNCDREIPAGRLHQHICAK